MAFWDILGDIFKTALPYIPALFFGGKGGGGGDTTVVTTTETKPYQEWTEPSTPEARAAAEKLLELGEEMRGAYAGAKGEPTSWDYWPSIESFKEAIDLTRAIPVGVPEEEIQRRYGRIKERGIGELKGASEYLKRARAQAGIPEEAGVSAAQESELQTALTQGLQREHSKILSEAWATGKEDLAAKAALLNVLGGGLHNIALASWDRALGAIDIYTGKYMRRVHEDYPSGGGGTKKGGGGGNGNGGNGGNGDGPKPDGDKPKPTAGTTGGGEGSGDIGFGDSDLASIGRYGAQQGWNLAETISYANKVMSGTKIASSLALGLPGALVSTLAGALVTPEDIAKEYMSEAMSLGKGLGEFNYGDVASLSQKDFEGMLSGVEKSFQEAGWSDRPSAESLGIDTTSDWGSYSDWGGIGEEGGYGGETGGFGGDTAGGAEGFGQ